MTSSFIIDHIYQGFRLKDKRFIREINAECLNFEHVKSGARLLKILSDDTNKTFAIGFKTFPESDNGAPHIMEHSVLNGSKNFPVKSPFDVLLKGSLSTFLNAFTSKDFTMYPVASMNTRDYFNLMHVYLDSVFNPLIYDDPKILKQEGWHHELTSPDEPVRYTGVVYNEMKGSFSNPQRELWYQVFRHLFPDNAYGFESGGTPQAIPTLTEEEFHDFHRKYYHPDNSYIFLYGDANLQEELEFIDRNYLSAFKKTDNQIDIKDQPAFGKVKDVTETYPYLDETDTGNHTFLTYNFVAGHNTDLALTFALDILCEVLVNQESAPLRLKLAEAGIGQDVSASSSNFLQHAVQIAAINANQEDKERFLAIIDQTLRQVVKEGLNKEEIEGVINRIEFKLREGDDAQKGLTYLNMSLAGWFFADDPYAGLEYETPLKEVKQALKTNYLEQIISRYFLDNPHTLVLSLVPSTSLEKERNEQVEKNLDRFKSALSDKELNKLVDETRQLIEHQQREDSPEALASIPMLKISDIDPKSQFYKAERSEFSGLPVLSYQQFTNDVVYVNLLFDMQSIPQELIPYTAFLTAVMGFMNTRQFDFGELNKLLNIHTGGFYTSPRIFLEKSDDERMIPKFSVACKAMNNKVGKMFDLMTEIVTGTVFEDRERLKTILLRHHSQLESQMKGNGFHVASRRFSSYISNQGMFREMTGGLSYYWFITDLVKNFDARADQIIGSLKSVSTLLFCRQNLMATISCAQNDMVSFQNGLADLAAGLPQHDCQEQNWRFTREHCNEGILASSNVQYVIKGYNFKKLGYQWNGKMRVLNQILSTDWLQTRIRVIGGAYGGFSSISSNGMMTFNSYRDPNLKVTLDNFNETGSYLANFATDPNSMTRYIIGTIAEMDSPLTPSQKAEQAIALYLSRRTPEELQQERDAVLSTTVEDIRSFAPLVEDVLKQDSHCVYGNSEKLTGEKELFQSLIRIDRG